ncbi:hypothetical protein FN846DRAFT_541941 [Sphaerosporella brunnea]|uniref:Uncharacterized protein n=1 Tax=Sphaerosporella brunnea TaxID=1250544 RepID=A0A5J5F2E1_9PEZI|nr:hypothetical protein FN846DRAFT_541941 [Sphaerosporella brunnea]
MLSIKLFVAAFIAAVSASGHDLNRHIRYSNYGHSNYGHGNNTISARPMGTGIGTGAPIESIVVPTTYTTATTNYVTVTYTLGNGAVKTATVTKTVQFSTTSFETQYLSTASVDSSAPGTTTVFHYVPRPKDHSSSSSERGTKTSTISERSTSTSTTTVTRTIPDTAYTSVTIAPEEHSSTRHVLTVTEHVTETSIMVVTTTVYPTTTTSRIVPEQYTSRASPLPPYANYTISTTVEDGKTRTTTLWTTITTTIPVVPTGTGMPVTY